MANETRPAGAGSGLIAASKISLPPTDSPQEARRAVRFDSRRVRARRAIVRELDELLGLFKYPNVATTYAIPPLREPEGGARP